MDQNYSKGNDIFINGIAISPDSSYVVAGYETNNLDNNEDIIVIKLDLSGDTTWTKTIGDAVTKERANALDVSKDSLIYMCGYSKNSVSGFYDENYLILDKLGNILTNSITPHSGDNVLNDVHVSGDTMIFAGYTTDGGQGGKDYRIFIDYTNGGFIYSRSIGDLADEICYHVEKTSDGGYVLCGTSTSFTPGLKSVYLVKLDSLFQASPIFISINENQNLPLQHISYPNPFDDFTIIDFKNVYSQKKFLFSVFNGIGEKVFSSIIDPHNQLLFFRNNLVRGFYTFSIYDDNKIVGGGKLIIE